MTIETLYTEANHDFVKVIDVGLGSTDEFHENTPLPTVSTVGNRMCIQFTTDEECNASQSPCIKGAVNWVFAGGPTTALVKVQTI